MRPAPLAIGSLVLGLVLARSLPGAATAGADPASGGLPDFAAMVERSEPAVVHIQSYLARPRLVPEADDRGSGDDAIGSGFVYAADGWIVTNRHVPSGSAGLYVHVLGRGWFEARVVGSDPVVDVAVLKIDAQGLTTLPIGNPRALRKGQWVVAAGSPYRLARSFSAGIVSGLERSDVGTPVPYEDFIQTDAAINLGSSGGPLLDDRGQVVGVTTAILSRSGGNQGIGFAVPIDVVVPVVEALRRGRPLQRPSIGAYVRDLAAREAIAVPGGVGQLVTRFAEDSPAKRAGLEAGDVILRVDGTPTPSRGILLRTIWGKPSGAPVTFDLWRRGQTISVAVRPVER
ncbi:MAG: trypsin-like peptidase domain-containing protein [Planctomycetes bacterium]|nr:trypsin-like peptidase domain-containing protein [Planctomycetota bacterium]